MPHSDGLAEQTTNEVDIIIRKRIRFSSMCFTGTGTFMVFMSLLNLGITSMRVLYIYTRSMHFSVVKNAIMNVMTYTLTTHYVGY